MGIRHGIWGCPKKVSSRYGNLVGQIFFVETCLEDHPMTWIRG